MSVLTPAQRATLQKCLAACNQALPRIELLEGLGAHSPALMERARELRSRRDYLVNLATTALELDRQISGKS
jgi:hypothetical protein